VQYLMTHRSTNGHEWATLHRREIQANWEKMKAGKPLERIAPLE